MSALYLGAFARQPEIRIPDVNLPPIWRQHVEMTTAI